MLADQCWLLLIERRRVAEILLLARELETAVEFCREWLKGREDQRLAGRSVLHEDLGMRLIAGKPIAETESRDLTSRFAIAYTKG